MRRFGASRILIAGCCVVMACGDVTLQAADYTTIDKWMTCEECINGERAAVITRGDAVVPLLRQALLYVPPNDEADMVRKQLAAAYATLQPPGVTLTQYVEPLFRNYVALRQVRAAAALSDIGTERAVRALDEALAPLTAVQYRADVLRTIRFLRTVVGSPVYTGTAAPRTVSFGDTVFVNARPSTPFTNRAIAVLDGSPFPADSLILLRNAARLGFAAVATSGAHMVAVIDSGVSPAPSVFSLGITSQTDQNDRGMRSCTTVACRVNLAQGIPPLALPYVSFVSLTSAGARIDTVDFFTITPASPLTITARLDWIDPVDLDLRWRTCSPFTTTGNAAGATLTNNPEVTSVTIPAGQCWVLLVTGPRAPGVQPVFARLRVTTP